MTAPGGLSRHVPPPQTWRDRVAGGIGQRGRFEHELVSLEVDQAPLRDTDPVGKQRDVDVVLDRRCGLVGCEAPGVGDVAGRGIRGFGLGPRAGLADAQAARPLRMMFTAIRCSGV